MASYAPLLAKEGNTQWKPDLIYFDNKEVKPTVNYFVQKLFSNNYGHQYYSSDLALSNPSPDLGKRLKVSVVKNDLSKEVIVKLVNILPVPVKSNLDLFAFTSGVTEAVKTCLSGQPEDVQSKIVTDTIRLDGTSPVELPPYSLTVIKFKTK